MVITPQQNVVKRKNKIGQEVARDMMDEVDALHTILGEARNIAVHLENIIQLRPNSDKTRYEF